MGRTPCCEKMGLKKGPWTPDEDRLLINYIRQHGHNNWRALPKQAGLLRCGKSCRLRWTNYLRPDIKRGNFTQEEEETIIKLHEMLGNRWSAIAARLPGRTDNEIKNVWHTHIKKKLINHHPGNGSTTSTTAAAAAINAIVVPTRKRARKAKAAIKVPKHENIMEPIESTTEGTNNKEGVMAMPTTTVVKNEPVSPQPCTSDVSTVTSTSTTTTTDNDNSSKENVGDHANNQDNNNNNILGELPELNDEFWMEVLSVEDTAMSIEEFPSISEYEPSSSEDVLFGTTTNSTAQSEDMDAFWHNLLTKSHDLPELMELLSKSDVS